MSVKYSFCKNVLNGLNYNFIWLTFLEHVVFGQVGAEQGGAGVGFPFYKKLI
jgi:hypothetical protein